jgi:hypothetical protein
MTFLSPSESDLFQQKSFAHSDVRASVNCEACSNGVRIFQRKCDQPGLAWLARKAKLQRITALFFDPVQAQQNNNPPILDSSLHSIPTSVYSENPQIQFNHSPSSVLNYPVLHEFQRDIEASKETA